MSYKVVVLANAVVDLCFQIDSFPILPAQHQVTSNRLFTPGAMANTLICGARLGLDMIAMGNIGDDDLAELWRKGLEPENIDVRPMIVIPNEDTSHALVLAEPSGEHVFLGARGMPNSGPEIFPPAWQEAISNAQALLLNGWNYISMGEAPNLVAAELARQHQLPIFYDPGPEIELFSEEWGAAMVNGATVLLLTYEESKLITGLQLPPEEMAEHLRQKGPELVILKLGGNGMIAHTANETVRHPGFKVEVVDLTAAGDSVAAAVMYSYLEGHSLEKMVTLANATGAACVRKFGAGTNVPYKHEVQAVLTEFGSTIAF